MGLGQRTFNVPVYSGEHRLVCNMVLSSAVRQALFGFRLSVPRSSTAGSVMLISSNYHYTGPVGVEKKC